MMGSICSSREKILLHLQRYRDQRSKKTVPYSLCQRGIGEKVALKRSTVSRYLHQLIEEGCVLEETKNVVGLKRKRKVYFLTKEGMERADELRKELREKRVILKTCNGEKDIPLRDIDDHISANDPLLAALNMEVDGKINLMNVGVKSEKRFVGRDEEMSRLKERLSSVKEGNGHTIFISGEGGIGKTTLAMQFKEHAVEEGFDFLSGRAFFESSEPYLPLKSALLDYLKSKRDRVKEAGYGGMGSMISAKGRDISAEIKDKNMFDAERHAMFYDITEEVRNFSEKEPIVIFLDDLQWADRGTLQLLYFMADKLQDASVFFINAYRPEYITDDHFLKEIQWRMNRNHLFDEIELKPLRLHDTSKIIKGLVGGSIVPDYLVQSVHEITEGNPLFIHEYLDHLVEERKIEPGKGRYPDKLDRKEIPERITEVVQGRVDMLGSETRKVLELCSVIGEDVPFYLLKKISGIDEIDLLDKLDILVGNRLLIEEPDEELFHFSHGLVHLAVYQGIQDLKREKLHKRTGKVMLDLYEEEVEEHFSDLGYHFEQGGELEQAIEYYRRAGKKAESVYAHEDAIERYQKVLELSKRIPKEQVNRFEVLEGLGDTHKIIGEYEKAIGYYEDALNETENMDEKQRMFSRIGGVLREKGEYDEALKTIEKGLSITEEDDIGRCRLSKNKGNLLMRYGDYEKAVEVFKEERSLAEKVGGVDERAQAVHDLGTSYLQMGDFDLAEEHLHDAVELRKETDEVEKLAATYNNLGVIHYQKGELKRALDYFQESIDIKEDIGIKYGLAGSYNNIGIIYRNRGELDKALEYYHRSMDIKEGIGDRAGIADSLTNIGVIYESKGEFDKAMEHYERSLEIQEELGDKAGVAGSYNNIGNTYDEMDELDKALEYYEKSMKISEEIGEKWISIHNLYASAEAYIQKGELEKAHENTREGIQLSIELGAKIEEAKGHRTLGMIFREQREWKRSEDEFEEGLEMLKEAGERTELSRIYYEYGLLFKERGDFDRAKEFLERASSTFEEMGMDLWKDKVRKELEELENG